VVITLSITLYHSVTPCNPTATSVPSPNGSGIITVLPLPQLQSQSRSCHSHRHSHSHTLATATATDPVTGFPVTALLRCGCCPLACDFEIAYCAPVTCDM